MSELIDYLKTLTLDDVQEWAGEKIYARGKGIIKNVSGLALTINDALFAKVQGTEQYETEVYFEDDELTSFCSCPLKSQLVSGKPVHRMTLPEPKRRLMSMQVNTFVNCVKYMKSINGLMNGRNILRACR